ncbi:MAG: hypothetical protein JXR37_28425 [Kiritimatiellae bacterium]|nr:hypothetical protein [Kiritimatiellia bacterium]
MGRNKNVLKAVGAALVFTVWFGAGSRAEIRKFRAAGRNFGVWRLTHDPAIRDEADYHNIQCWSSNGRYTCYTHWGGDEGPGGKDSAEVHVVDLATGEDRLVDEGINPRWAKHSHRLFYCHFTHNGKPWHETGTQLIRYDADTGEKVVITHGMLTPSGLDPDDKWVYGTQRFKNRTPQYNTVRARNMPGSALEVLKDAPSLHHRLVINPRHPAIAVRDKQSSTGTVMDLEGKNHRAINHKTFENGHCGWRGDGEYWVIGDGPGRGRKWNETYPGDLEVFTWGQTGGDISPCGNSGRYVCFESGILDIRSGDHWWLVHHGSGIIWPMPGDLSHIVDINSKGSPDGTKIHFNTTCDIENLVMTGITKWDEKEPDVLHVESTAGFPASGDLVLDGKTKEVVGYERKTETTFEGLTRRKYDTRRADAKTRLVSPLSRFLLSPADKARLGGKPPRHMRGLFVRHGLPADHPLVFQRQSDCYVAVARLPFPPHLRARGGAVELIPGEAHWETRGYRLLRDGKPIGEELSSPGASFSIAAAGVYTAVAVEWSGLESPPSLPLSVRQPSAGRVLREKPADFEWARDVWKVAGKTVSEPEAGRAAQAVRETVHLHDGLIAREVWERGAKARHIDFNEQGKPIRHLDYEDGVLRKRYFKNPGGELGIVEWFGRDGFKTEYVMYDVVNPANKGGEKDHTWYDHGHVTRCVRAGKLVFDAKEKPLPSREEALARKKALKDEHRAWTPADER